MEPFTIEETTQGIEVNTILNEELGANIKVVGVGGAGGNMVNHMINSGSTGVHYYAANTDIKDLHTSQTLNRIQLGVKLTKGLGAGMRPEKGKDSAVESYEDLKNSLNDADIVFIAAGLGGGTGTGAAPIVAKAAKEVGALTISVVTTPFKFEGRKRTKLAEAGLLELKKESDSIVVIPNQKLLSIVEKTLGQSDAYKMADEVLHRAVNGTSSIILSDSNGGITVDFADFQTVMSYRGTALMGIGEFQGQNAAYEALKTAIESPLLDNVSIQGAMGILVNFTIHKDYSLIDIGEAMEAIEDKVDEDADIIHGTTYDNDLPADMVKITVIATGFEKEENTLAQKSLNNVTSIATNETNSTSTTNIPNNHSSVTMRQKTVGSDLSEDILDIPTWMRQKRD
jgi:cell division protein FtsZ